ncbi:MAG: glycoside hydrolase family 3 protein [Clostridiales bacterium]|nr:glycoside hydrolase family 3 protein [Clostridiales bacterium]
MTLAEKVSQMVYDAPAIPRLGIPAYNWWNEALHGVARAGVATVFPQAIGLAASFDPDLVEQVAGVISDEARAKHHEAARRGDRGIYKGLTFWSPNINLFRDPRWGRGHETYGEDPFLTSRLGVAFCRGLQGDDPVYLKAAACAKHYAVHSGPEADRHHFNAEVSIKDMEESYLPAFEACVREAGVEAVMGAYNRVNGEPCCASPTLLTDILRGRWGFRGHVVSDCGAIADIHKHHRATSDAAESAALAVKNGCDLNCGSVFHALLVALERGLIGEDEIDRACHRLMRTRLRLGMFDPPERVRWAGIPYEVNDSAPHHALALEAARRTVVLLKNDGLLPLNPAEIKTITVIGPNADSLDALLGNYNGTPSEYYTVLRGVRAVCPDARVLYAPGCSLAGPVAESAWGERDTSGFAEAMAAADRADAVIVCLGLDAHLEGEEGAQGNGGDKTDIALPRIQQRLLEAVVSTGKPVILVNLTGSAVDMRYADERCAAILQGWYPGQYGGMAIAETIFGQNCPSGRLPVTFYRDESQLPPFEDYSMEGRTYRFFRGEPLYPFGYGLSYTRFEYEGASLSPDTVAAGEDTSLTVTVSNAGSCAGRETVQVYIRDMEATVRTPIHSLIAVGSVWLAPGASRTLIFSVPARAMAVVRDDGSRVVEPGEIRVYAGGQQPDERSAALTGSRSALCTLTVTGAPYSLS